MHSLTLDKYIKNGCINISTMSTIFLITQKKEILRVGVMLCFTIMSIL